MSHFIRSVTPHSLRHRSGLLNMALILALLFGLAPATVAQAALPARALAQEVDLEPYTHPDGLFTIDRPAIFTVEESVPGDEVMQILDWVTAASFFALYDEQSDQNALAFVFLDNGVPFGDAMEWQQGISDILTALYGGGVEVVDSATDVYPGALGEEYYLRQSIRLDDGTLFSLAAYGTDSLMGFVLAGAPSDWDILEPTLNAAVDTFIWDAEAVAAYLGAEIGAGSSAPVLAPTPAVPAPSADVEFIEFSPDDGLYTIQIPPTYLPEDRQQIQAGEVGQVFPGLGQGVLSALADNDDFDNVVATFFFATPPGLELDDPVIWADVAALVTNGFVAGNQDRETLIDDFDNLHLRQFIDGEVNFYLDIYGDDGFVIAVIAGGPDWEAVQPIMLNALDSFAWDADAVRDELGVTSDSSGLALLQPTPQPTPEVVPEPDDPATDEPTDEPTGEFEDEGLEEVLDELLEADPPGAPALMEFLVQLEDPENVFSAYVPPRLQGESSGEWTGDVYTVYHVHWATDAEYEDIYYTAYIATIGPANQVMMINSEIDEEDLPAPSLAIPTLEEWNAWLALYEESVILPADANRARYDLPNDPYGVLYYADATDPSEDESYRMWTYMTQQDGLGIVVLLLGPLVEPESIPLYADETQRVPVPIDLGLESLTWDLATAKAAVLNRLSDRYSPAEIAALTLEPYSDPLGGFTMEVPLDLTNRIRSLEADAYSLGVRTPGTRNGLFLRFTDLGEPLSAEEWIEVQDIIAAEFWPLVNTNPDDPAPRVLAEEISSDTFNYAAYEVVGTAQHGLFEFIEMDGLFAFAAGLVELDEWETREAEIRALLDSVALDTDVILENLAVLADLPAGLSGLTVEGGPSGDAQDAVADAEPGRIPLVVRAEFTDSALDQTLALLITGPDGQTVGQITGVPDEIVGNTGAITLETGETDGLAATFRFSPVTPWQPGLHNAQIYYANTLLGEIDFYVGGLPADQPDATAFHHSQLIGATGQTGLEDAAGEQEPVFNTNANLRYDFSISLPIADHQVRVFVYHDGYLVPELTHTWRLPRGAELWQATVALEPEDGWLPGDYTLRLWVNENPWDEQNFSIHEDGEQDGEQSAAATPLTLDNASTLTLLTALEPTMAPEYIDMAYVNGGQALATLNLDNELVVYDTTTWAEIHRHGLGIFGWNLTASPDGSRLAIAYQDVSELDESGATTSADNFPIVVWDTADWTVDAVLEGHAGTVTALGFDPTSEWLLTIGLDSTLRTWSLAGDLPSAQYVEGLAGDDWAITTLDFSNDGQRVGLVYSDGLGEMWRIDLQAGEFSAQPLYNFEVGGQNMHHLRMFPAGLSPAVADALAGPAMLVTAHNEIQVWTYYDQVAELTYAFTDPDNNRLVAADLNAGGDVAIIAGDTTWVVDLVQGELVEELDYTLIQMVAISPTGQVALMDGSGDIFILAAQE